MSGRLQRQASCPDLSAAVAPCPAPAASIPSPRQQQSDNNAARATQGSENGAASVSRPAAVDEVPVEAAQLKLAPILARRLEQVLQQEQAGTSSSKSSCTSRQTSCTSRSMLSPRMSADPECPNMPLLLRRLEGKHVAKVPLLGSCNLSQVVSKDPHSPSASKKASQQGFDIAKAEVNKDLGGLKVKAEAMQERITGNEPDADDQREYLARLLDSIEESLEASTDEFKNTIADIIDVVEEDRAQVKNASIKALYTRLLFSLSRCSRLLVTEQLNMFTAEPNRAQRFGDVLQKVATASGVEGDDTIYRSHTMPVKRMAEMAQQILQEKRAAAGRLRGPGDSLSLGTMEAPKRPGLPSRLVMETLEELPGELTGGDTGSPRAPSPVGASSSLVPKKSKGFFHKVKKTWRKTLDSFMTKSGKDKLPSGSISPASQPSMLQPSAPSSPLPHNLLHSASLPGPSGLQAAGSAAAPATPAKAEPQAQAKHSVRFACDSPKQERASAEGAGAGGEAGATPSGPLSPAGIGERPSGYSGRPSHSRRSHVRFLNSLQDVEVGAGGHPSSATQASRKSFSDAAGMRKQGEGDAPPLSMVAALRGRSVAALDTYPAWRDCTPSAPVSDVGMEQPVEEEVEPEVQDVVCSVCEEAWAASRLEEHSDLCAVLLTVGQGMSVDAHLTTLANAIEEQLDMECSYAFCSGILKLIRLARSAAALQPDGSNVPNTRCASILRELQDMTDPAVSLRLDTLAFTYARRIAKLTREKLNFLTEALQRHRGSEGGNSGTSTPRSAPGMSIDEFEIIKPISRGAFGRVYLARKLATKDLFAIKVMKKKDLIRKNMVESVNNERNILALANNPFVVRFYYSFTSKENLYIVMEYLNGGDFSSLLRKFGALDEDVARQYIAETVMALEYCHTQGIIHRDLKPDNILISSDGRVKLTDFGLSCVGVIEKADDLTHAPREGHDMADDATDAFTYDASVLSVDVDMEDVNSSAGQYPSSHRQVPPRPQLAPPISPHADQMQLSQLPPRSSAPVQGTHLPPRMDSPGPLHGAVSTSIPGVQQVARNPTNGGYTGEPMGPPPPAPGGLLGKRLMSERSSGGNTGDRSSDRNTGDRSSERSGMVSEQPRLVVPEHEARRAVGTPDYLAPELLLGTGHGPEVDWWALGAILFEYIIGTPPFNADTPEEIFENILDRRIPWPDDPEDMSPECRDLIDRLLEPDVEQRLGHRGAAEIKMHPWFKDVDWQNLAKNKVAFVPHVRNEIDTSYFLEKKPVSAKSMHEDIILEKVSRRTSSARERSDRLSPPPPAPPVHSNSLVNDTDRSTQSAAGGRRGHSSTRLELVSLPESGVLEPEPSLMPQTLGAGAVGGMGGLPVETEPARMSNSGRSRLMVMTDPATDPGDVRGVSCSGATLTAGSTGPPARVSVSAGGLVVGVVEGAEGDAVSPGADPQDMSRSSPSGSSESSTGVQGDDPFQNFTCTNFNSLSAANADKVSKLKQRDSLTQPSSSRGSVASPTPLSVVLPAVTRALALQGQAQARSSGMMSEQSDGSPSSVSFPGVGGASGGAGLLSTLPPRPSRLVVMDLAQPEDTNTQTNNTVEWVYREDLVSASGLASTSRNHASERVSEPIDLMGGALGGPRMPFAHCTSGIASPIPGMPRASPHAPQQVLQAVKEQLQARFLDAMASSSSGGSSGEHMLPAALSRRRHSRVAGEEGQASDRVRTERPKSTGEAGGKSLELTIRVTTNPDLRGLSGLGARGGGGGGEVLEALTAARGAARGPGPASCGGGERQGGLPFARHHLPPSRPSSMSRLNNHLQQDGTRSGPVVMEVDREEAQSPSPARQGTPPSLDLAHTHRQHYPLSPHARSSSGVLGSPSVHTGSNSPSRLSQSGPASPGANSPARMSCSGMSATGTPPHKGGRQSEVSPANNGSPLRLSALGISSPTSLPGSPMSRLGHSKTAPGG